jgi:hypothetical protein
MRKLLVVAALTLLAGCPRLPPIRPDAFDDGQQAALLSIQVQPKVAIWAAPGTEGPELDAAPLLAQLRAVVVEAMARNPHFKLVPEAKVLAAPAYAAHPAAAHPSGYLAAPGYKPVTDEALYPVMAREAGADMGIGVMLNLAYREGDGAAAVVVSVGAIDVKGRGVWKGGATAISDQRVDVRTAGAKARNEAFKDAARKAMAQLEESMTEQLAFELARRRTER